MKKAKKSSKSVKSVKRVAKPRGPSKAEQAAAAKVSRDAHFAAVVNGLRTSMTDMQLRPDATENFNSSLDEIQALYSAR